MDQCCKYFVSTVVYIFTEKCLCDDRTSGLLSKENSSQGKEIHIFGAGICVLIYFSPKMWDIDVHKVCVHYMFLIPLLALHLPAHTLTHTHTFIG